MKIKIIYTQTILQLSNKRSLYIYSLVAECFTYIMLALFINYCQKSNSNSHQKWQVL